MKGLALTAVTGVGLVAVIVVLALFGAFTISTLWGWFVVPLGVQSIGMAHAYGLCLMVSVFMGTRGINDDSKNILLKGVILNILSLALGGIALSFM